MKRIILLIYFVGCTVIGFAQQSIGGGVVNAYAQITSRAGNTFTIGTQTGAAHSFSVGDYVMIAQMTGNTAAGGGLYQIAQITAVSGSTITVNGTMRAYDSPSSEVLQMVWVPYSTTGFTTSGNIIAQPWNGTTGGIVALKTPKTITLGGKVSADSTGFSYLNTKTVYGEGLYGGGGGGGITAGGGAGGGGYGATAATGTLLPQNAGLGGTDYDGTIANPGGAAGGGTSIYSGGLGTYGGGGGGGNGTYGFGAGGGKGGTHNGGAAQTYFLSKTNTNYVGGGGGGGSYGGGGGGEAYFGGGGGGGASPTIGGCGGSGFSYNVASTPVAGAINGIGWVNGNANANPEGVGAGGGGGGMFAGGGGGGGGDSQGAYIHFGGDGGGFIPTAGYKNFMNTTDPRLFMGGAGSDTTGVGAHGGGIVLLDAAIINGNNQLVSANGANGYTKLASPNYGAAFGGGAGGNILITASASGSITNTSAIGGKGAYAPNFGNYYGGNSGGGGGGGIWVMSSIAATNINPTATMPIISNLYFNVNGGGVTPGSYSPKFGIYDGPQAGCGGAGIVLASNTCTPSMIALGLCACQAGATAPVLSATTMSNVCPSLTVNLNSLVTSTCPTGSSLEWHTSSTPTTANIVSTPTAMGTTGVYYAVCYDATNLCYSPISSALTATITGCPIIATVKVASVGTSTANVPFTYTLTTNNVSSSPTVGTITIKDTLQAGLSNISAAGTNWVCSVSGQIVTCNSTVVIPAGSTASPIMINVTPNGVASSSTIYNTAWTSGGGMIGGPYKSGTTVANAQSSSNTSGGTPTIVLGNPNLTTVKTASVVTATAGVPYSYTLVVNNIGTVSSNGIITIKDTLQAGLSFNLAGGANWTCTNSGQIVTCTTPSVIVGNSAAAPITINVTPSLTATMSNILNTAWTSGGGMPGGPYKSGTTIPNSQNPANPSGGTPTIVLGSPVLVTTKAASVTTAVANTPFNYTLIVNNINSVSSNGTITIKDTLQAGLTYNVALGSNWNCNAVGQIVTCTTNSVVTGNSTANPITISVTPSASAVTANIINKAWTNGGGMSGGPYMSGTSIANGGSSLNPTGGVPVIIKPNSPDLTTVLSPSTATGTANVPFTYTATVTNVGVVTTTGPATETITLPAGMTYVSGGANGWVLTSQVGQVLTFTNPNPSLAPNGSSTFPVVVTPTTNGSYTTNAVVAGGGEINTTNNTSSAVLTVATPDLITTISPATGTGTVNTPYNYTVSVTNIGNATTTGSATETITLPAGLTYVSGGANGWVLTSQVGQVLTFTNPNPNLATNGVSNFPIVVTPTANGTYTTPVVVAGGGEINTTNNTSSAVLTVATPDLTTTITPATGTGTVNTPYNYTVTVNNIGTATTTGSATETITLPAGLTYVSGGGNGWVLASQVGQVLTFTNPNPNLASNGTTNFPLVVTPTTSGTFTTPVTIAGGGETNTTNNTSSAVLTVSIPDLTTTITPATGTGTVNTPYNYTVTVNNIGSATTTGAATETITLPAGLTYVSGGANGWVLTSQVGQVLTFTNPNPNLASNGTTNFPLLVTPTASGTYTTPVVVGGGGETNTTNNTSSAVLTVSNLPDLTTTITPTPSTGTVNTPVTYTVTATNVGGATTTGAATETITLPAGLTYVSGGANGWVLTSQVGQVLTFTNPNPSLAPNGSSTFPVVVTPTTSGTFTTPVVIAGGGEINTTNNTSSAVLTVAIPPDLITTITPTPSNGTINTPTTYTVTASNIGGTTTTGPATETITLPAGVTYVSGGGNGWVLTSQVGQVLTFTNPNPSLAPNGSSTFPVVVTPTTSGTFTTPVVIAGGGEINITNNTSSAVLTVATPPDLTTTITPTPSNGTVNTPTTYTVTASNIGGTTTSGSATETITLPAGVTYVSGGGNGWVLTSQVGQVLTFTNPNPSIAPNGSSTFPVVVTPTTSGTFTTPVVIAGGGEINTTNNTNSALLTVGCATINLASGNFTTTNPTSCNGSQGTIKVCGLTANTSYSVAYNKNGAAQTAVTLTSDPSGCVTMTGLMAGTYNNFNFTNNTTLCPTGVQATSVTLTSPASSVITLGTTSNPTTCGSATGLIQINGLTSGTTYTLNYTLNGTAQTPISFTAAGTSYTLNGLTSGNYSGIIVSNSGCVSNALSQSLSDPTTASISMGASTNPTSCSGNDGTFVVSGLAPGTTYTLYYSKDGMAQTPITFTAAGVSYSVLGLTKGSYTNVRVSNAGCVSNSVSAILSDPSAAIIALGTPNNPASCGASNGSITITGLAAGTTYTIQYKKNGIWQTPISYAATSSSYTITGLSAASYTNISASNGGCTSNGLSIGLTDPNAATIGFGTITQPTYCGAANGSITITGLTTGLSYILNYVKDGVQQGVSVFTASGTTYTLPALVAGNYTGINVNQGGCISNTLNALLSNPGGATIDAVAVNPLTCSPGNDGSVLVTGLSSSLSYILNYSKDGIAQTAIAIPAGSTSYRILGLTAAAYTNITVTQGGCISNTANVTLYSPTLIVAPALSLSSVKNTCPSATSDLSTVTASNAPTGTSLTWHTATPATAANQVSDMTSVASGTYYASFYNATTQCYGATTPITATFTACVPDLTTTITPANTTVSVNTPITYSVTATNIGTVPTTTTSIETITIPNGMTYVPAGSGGNGWVCTQSGTTLTCTNPSPIAANGSSNFPVILKPTTTGTITTPVVVSGGGETNTSNNTANAVLNVTGLPDLTTTITPTPSNGTVNTPVTYTVTATNIGSTPTTGSATETINLPAGMTYVSGGGNGWVLTSQVGQVLTFTNANPNLATNGSSTFPVVLTPTTSGTFTTPVVIGGGGEANTSNNTSSAVLTVSTLPDLTTTITPTPSNGTVNSPVTYTVTATNIGGTPTTGSATETINLPAGMTYVSGGGNGWVLTSQSGQVLTFTNANPNLATNGSSTFPVILTPTTSGTITTPVVIGGGGEINTSNNTSSAVLTVSTLPDLITSITPANTTGTVNTPLTYTVTATNIGGTPTTGSATETITVPAGMTYVSGGGNGWVLTSQSGQVLTFTNANPNLATNGSSTFPVVLTPTTGGTFTTPVVIGGGGEINTSNNTSNAVLTVGVPDLTTTIAAATTSGSIGTPISFTATVSNIGSAATSGTQTETIAIPAGMTYVPGSVSITNANGWTLVSATSQLLTFTNSSAINTTASGATATTITYNATPTVGGSFTNTSTVSIASGETITTNNTSNVVVTVGCGKLTVRAYLQGAESNDLAFPLMRDDLRSGGLIPLNQPYYLPDYTDIGYLGGEVTTSGVLSVTGSKAVVDWVMVELRDKTTPTTIVSRQAALLLRDGSIVQVDGVSPLQFCITVDNYYVAVRHRNHLGVMTASPVALTSAGSLVDFTLPSTATYSRTDAQGNPYPQKQMGNVMALWAGNALMDMFVKAQGSSADKNAITSYIWTDPGNTTISNSYFVNRYARTDIDMNGLTKMQGSTNDIDFLYSVIWYHPMNTTTSNVFFFYQQLP